MFKIKAGRLSELLSDVRAKTKCNRRGIKNDTWISREQHNELCSEAKNAEKVSGMNYRLAQFWIERQATETNEGNILKRWKLKVLQIMDI